MSLQRSLVRKSLLLIAIAAIVTSLITPIAVGKQDIPALPKAKQTNLGLYVTAKQAYQKWLTASDAVKIFDVRTLEEYIYIGHAPMAWNIPLMSQTHEWNADKGYFALQPNPDFVSLVREIAVPTDTILVMCRSGGRSAMAVNLLAKAGFAKVYNITDGMEGDAIKDSDSEFKGQRLKNGWKNSGVRWTYKIDPDRVRLVNR